MTLTVDDIQTMAALAEKQWETDAVLLGGPNAHLAACGNEAMPPHVAQHKARQLHALLLFLDDLQHDSEFQSR